MHTIIDSPLGRMLLVAEDEAITGVHFADSERAPACPEEQQETPVLATARRQLAEYFAGRRTRFDLPLAPRGEAYQQRVWRLLTEIPYGETRSYGDLARELGDVGHSQAVGAANGRNPVSVIVPCHRVIGADGSLTGYAGGLARKRYLLALEEPAAADAGRLF